MFGLVELSWAYAGFCWVVFGPSWLPRVASGLRLLYFRFTLDHLGTSWAYVGPHFGSMLGVAEVNVAPSWLSVGLS